MDLDIPSTSACSQYYSIPRGEVLHLLAREVMSEEGMNFNTQPTNANNIFVDTSELKT